MADRNASTTALGVAALRAAHQLLDPEPHILEDGVVVRLLGHPTLERIGIHTPRFETPGALALRSHVVLRSRVAEDHLRAAVERGARQYIVLGAGFDTFAYRQPAWARGLRVVEIDQPASQGAKRDRLQAAHIEVPANVLLADVDFEHETLSEGLVRHGVSTDVVTFFSWLGVTMYLTRDAIASTLRTIARFPAGSEVVLTFAQPRAHDASDGPSLADRAAELGEPWLSYFTADEITGLLRETGFREAEVVTPATLEHEYFHTPMGAGLPAPMRATIAVGVV